MAPRSRLQKFIRKPGDPSAFQRRFNEKGTEKNLQSGSGWGRAEPEYLGTDFEDECPLSEVVSAEYALPSFSKAAKHIVEQVRFLESSCVHFSPQMVRFMIILATMRRFQTQFS